MILGRTDFYSTKNTSISKLISANRPVSYYVKHVKDYMTERYNFLEFQVRLSQNKHFYPTESGMNFNNIIIEC